MSRDRTGFRRFYGYLDECALLEPLKAIAARHRAHLFDVYSDAATAAAIGARLEMWFWLMSETNRSPNEIAAIFDRERGSIAYAIDRLRDAARARDTGLAPDTVGVLAQVVGQEMARRKRLRVIKKKG